MAFLWRADDGPFIAVLDPLSAHQLNIVIKFGPPVTKLSGFAQASMRCRGLVSGL